MAKLLLILIMVGLWSSCGRDYATQTHIEELSQENITLQGQVRELSAKLDSLLSNDFQEAQENVALQGQVRELSAKLDSLLSKDFQEAQENLSLQGHVRELSAKLDSLLSNDFQEAQENVALQGQVRELSAKLDSLLSNDFQEAQEWIEDISTKWVSLSKNLSDMSFSEFSGMPISIGLIDTDLLIYNRVADDEVVVEVEQFQYYRDSENGVRIRHGWYSNHYEHNGGYASIGQYEDGLKQGAWFHYTIWGWLFDAEFYENGELVGARVEFHPDGRISRTENYVDGKLDGIISGWYQNGQQETIEKYSDGQVTYSSRYVERINFPLKEVYFDALDGLTIRGVFAHPDTTKELPTITLLHDLGGNHTDWWNRSGNLISKLIERNYAVLAIDLRGHGQTPLPNERQVLELNDLENSFLDVHAALNWFQGQSAVDANRIAVVGAGSGGNVAYVSKGIFPDQIRTAICISPGLWERTSLQPVVVGSGIDPFDPRSILFMVGEEDLIQGGDITLRYVDFARNLEALTAEPKDLRVFQNSADHGFELLNNVPEALDLLLLWLETIIR